MYRLRFLISVLFFVWSGVPVKTNQPTNIYMSQPRCFLFLSPCVSKYTYFGPYLLNQSCYRPQTSAKLWLVMSLYENFCVVYGAKFDYENSKNPRYSPSATFGCRFFIYFWSSSLRATIWH